MCCSYCEVFIGFHVCYLPGLVLFGVHNVIQNLRDRDFTDKMLNSLREEACRQDYNKTLKILDDLFFKRTARDKVLEDVAKIGRVIHEEG